MAALRCLLSALRLTPTYLHIPHGHPTCCLMHAPCGLAPTDLLRRLQPALWVGHRRHHHAGHSAGRRLLLRALNPHLCCQVRAVEVLFEEGRGVSRRWNSSRGLAAVVVHHAVCRCKSNRRASVQNVIQPLASPCTPAAETTPKATHHALPLHFLPSKLSPLCPQPTHPMNVGSCSATPATVPCPCPGCGPSSTTPLRAPCTRCGARHWRLSSSAFPCWAAR